MRGNLVQSESSLNLNQIGDVNFWGDYEHEVRLALTLLIEEKLEIKEADWVTYIPSPYKNFIYVEKGCPVDCPTPSDWSSWSCFCPRDFEVTKPDWIKF